MNDSNSGELWLNPTGLNVIFKIKKLNYRISRFPLMILAGKKGQTGTMASSRNEWLHPWPITGMSCYRAGLHDRFCWILFMSHHHWGSYRETIYLSTISSPTGSLWGFAFNTEHIFSIVRPTIPLRMCAHMLFAVGSLLKTTELGNVCLCLHFWAFLPSQWFLLMHYII